MAPVAPARAMNLKQDSTFVTWVNGLAMDTRKNMSYWLVVSTNPSENMNVSWDDDIPN